MVMKQWPSLVPLGSADTQKKKLQVRAEWETETIMRNTRKQFPGLEFIDLSNYFQLPAFFSSSS